MDKIYVFLERDEDVNDIADRSRLVFVKLGRRMEFRDVVDHAQQNLAPGTILAVLNLDIFLEDSKAWGTVDRDFFCAGRANKALVLKRHNLDENMQATKETRHWEIGHFCDAWVMKTPLDPGFLGEDLEFCVGGAPGCDQVMMYLMHIYYHTYSWGDKYRIFHFDICRKNGNTRMITNEKTDWRPKQRRDQHVSIPANQDWDTLLRTGQRPVVKLRGKLYVDPRLKN